VHQPALEIKVTQQPSAIFFDRELTAKLATIHREMIRVAGAPLRRGFALARHALRGYNSLIDWGIFFRG
jgi:predicted ATPase